MMNELVVVATDRQVELVAREGCRAETRRRLLERLATVLLHSTRFADAVTSRAALAMVLERALEDEPLVEKVSRSLGAWERMVDAVDDALDVLRAEGVTARALGEIESEVPVARVLRKAMNALDARLDRAGLVDLRVRSARLAVEIEKASPEDVARIVSARSARARWIVQWTKSDGAWWSALAAAMRRAGGEVVVELPIVEKVIDAARAADPFEIVVGDVARVLDEAPTESALRSVLGDLTFTSAVSDAARAQVVIRRGLDADAQARAVVGAVLAAIDEGVATDRVAIGLPRGTSDASKEALVRHFDEANVALHFGGATGVRGALVDTAFGALRAGSLGLPRRDVADLLRSRAIDATAATGVDDARTARRAMRDLAEVLERTPTLHREARTAEDALERFVATVGVGSRAFAGTVSLARRVGEMLIRAERVVSRAEHVRGARAMFAALGLAARAGSAVRATLERDDAATALAWCEVEAYARDARALEALGSALDDVERADVALGDGEACAPATFRHELERAMWGRGAGGAARVGAVRAMRLEELAGEPLELLVVIDANDGVLPVRAEGAGVVTPALLHALRRHDNRADAPSVPSARSLVELACATEHAARVVVAYRAADDDGAALAPSPFASWLERGGVTAAFVHAAPLLGAPTTPHERDLALLALAPDRALDLAPHAARIAAREREREAFHASPGNDPSEIVGRLAPDLRTLLDHETGSFTRPLSVTAIERMARCPFQGFAAQILGALADDPRADDTPDRREEGILAHDALGAAFTAAASLWSARPRDARAIESVAMRAADAVLARSSDSLVRAALDRIRAEIVRLVALAIDDETWDFAYAEPGFGNVNDAWPSLAIDDGVDHLSLRGRIDRIDVAHDGSRARVIDYKRRVTLPVIGDLGVTSLQVPIYALVARRNVNPATPNGRYLSTISPARASTTAFDERFASLVERDASGTTEIERVVLAHVHALRHGQIAPVPSAPKSCAFCGLDGACRRPRFAVTMLDRDEGE